MRSLLRAGAAFLLALPFLTAQTSPVTVTATQVSVNLNQPLFCAARWTKPNVQVYCYTSSAGHTWDQLIYNSIFPVTTNVTLPYVLPCFINPTTACTQTTGIMWLFKPGATTGTVSWEVAWNGSGDQKGTFQ